MTEFVGDGVIDLFREKKAKRRPEQTTATTSNVIKTRRVLRCLVGGCDGGAVMMVGGSVSGLGNEGLSGLPAVEGVKGVCLFVADGVSVEGNGLAGVISSG